MAWGGTLLRIHTFRIAGAGCRGPSERRRGGRGSPAIQFCFSRFRGTVQYDPAQLQETQIVQSQFDLRDLLP